jgi:hypothetical protein
MNRDKWLLEKQVSKARKRRGIQATNGIPGNPVNIAGVNKNSQRVVQSIQTYGKN